MSLHEWLIVIVIGVAVVAALTRAVRARRRPSHPPAWAELERRRNPVMWDRLDNLARSDARAHERITVLRDALAELDAVLNTPGTSPGDLDARLTGLMVRVSRLEPRRDDDIC